ncbi:MAG: type II toxin-antitoxin system VapC family toxin [Planctomycetes bacterium]|nr:type II toxin-antitoxin system VapC family toxin [Planctomycetota bacterium]
MARNPVVRARPKPAPAGDYWDACIFIDYVQSKSSADSNQATALWDEAKEKKRVIHTSVITIAEVAWYMANTTTLTEEESKKIDALWHPDGPVQLWEVTPELATQARQIRRDCRAKQPSIPIDNMDAIHLATARSIPVARFITKDHFKYAPEREKTTNLPDQRPTLSAMFGMELCHARPETMQFADAKLPHRADDE